MTVNQKAQALCSLIFNLSSSSKPILKLSPTLMIGLFSSLMLTLGACSINPATGTPDVVFTSQSGEIEIGKKTHAKLMESATLYPDKKVQAYVNQVGQKLAKNSDRPNIAYHFFVIDSPDINAFAAPGGYVYINRGLLAFLNNEAQLAAVLAHEIAHITARHGVRQKSAAVGAKTLTIMSTVLTRSGEVGEATGLYATAAVKGYGRDMELEADGFGAKYLNASGYPASAMIDVVSILKDHSTYQKRRARAAGKSTSGYHGLFASHPRNDQRLRQLINAENTSVGKTNEIEFRKNINGLVFGHNYLAATSQAQVAANTSTSDSKPSSTATSNPATESESPSSQIKKFRHSSLGFSFTYPGDWQAKQSRSSVDINATDKHASLQLLLEKHSKQTPEAWLRNRFKIKLLRQSEPLYQNKLNGHTGIIKANDGKQQRLAVFFKGSLAFTFQSAFLDQSAFDTADEEFMEIIASFRPERRRSNASASTKNKSIRFVRANAKTRFADLARHAGLGRNGEDTLRLLNGYYPRGEPRAGDIIKIIQ